jgi:myo-inositol 2-dehydrogenase/D-chiro-inositol 1-dehydrogenase
VVVITFDNGAIAVAEASFSAVYGYDVRGEVFGSAGMITMGDTTRSSLVHSTSTGRHVDTVRGDVELFRDAYTAEFVEFTDAVREGRTPAVTGEDARRALTLALASIESVQTGVPVAVQKVTAR